jgi:hypothetical protein
VLGGGGGVMVRWLKKNAIYSCCVLLGVLIFLNRKRLISLFWSSLGSPDYRSAVSDDFRRYWREHDFILIDQAKDASKHTVEQQNNEFAGVVHQYEKYRVVKGSNINPEGWVKLPLWSIPTKFTEFEAFNRSILNLGNVLDPSYVMLSDKLLNRQQCVTVIVIGGSVSCAGTKNKIRKNAPKSLADSYAFKLEKLLNSKFPRCRRSQEDIARLRRNFEENRVRGHIVDNRCHNAAGTGRFIDAVSAWKADPFDAVLGKACTLFRYCA